MVALGEYISLAEAAGLAPGAPCYETVWRWARQGVTARNGQVVKLRHLRAGAKLFTTQQWLEQFMEDLAAADGHAPQRQSCGRRARTIPLHGDAEAAEALRKAGI